MFSLTKNELENINILSLSSVLISNLLVFYTLLRNRRSPRSVFMSFSVMFVINVVLVFILQVTYLGDAHINVDRSHLSELKKICEHAYSCFHDTVIVCGKSVSEARTFIDLCDLYEYSCEYTMVFRHVKEEEDVCPNPKELQPGVG